MSIFSTDEELAQISRCCRAILRLPVSQSRISGSILESVFSFVRKAEYLNTYDYVDVIDPNKRLGWSLKVTKENTPVTWKRAKIPNQRNLVDNSLLKGGVRRLSGAVGADPATEELGNTIIDFCNAHVMQSIEKYDLNEVGYVRLIQKNDGSMLYFERQLCSRENPNIFDRTDFTWSWSVQKSTRTKEQLTALHGFHKNTQKWWAWHALGENQLRF